MLSQWRVQESNEFLPLQLTVMDTLTYLPGLRRQIQSLDHSNTSISAGKIVKDSYASALETARRRSIPLYKLLTDAERQCKIASETMGTREFAAKDDLRSRALAELDAAEATLIQALEVIRREVFPHVASDVGAGKLWCEADGGLVSGPPAEPAT